MEDINGSRPNAAPKPKKRPNRFVRFLAFLVTLALMVGAVALVANYDKLNFDFIKRWFSYRTLARNDSGQAESFHFVGDSSNAFAVVDGDLLYLIQIKRITLMKFYHYLIRHLGFRSNPDKIVI